MLTNVVRVLVACVMALLLWTAGTRLAAAAPSQAPGDIPSEQAGPSDNGACLRCHRTPALDMALAGGERMALTIDPYAYAVSAHNRINVSCLTCHPGRDAFPHPKITSSDQRQYQLDYYPSCKGCHAEQFGKGLDSMHQRALAGGDQRAPVCSDCHDPHAQRPVKEQARAAIATTCGSCHKTIYTDFRSSVHGAALVQDSPDVPACTDCHGAHSIGDPAAASFRLRSPAELCGSCHTDPQRVQKYGLSSQVLSTYLADFHGTTASLDTRDGGGLTTKVAVCYECHGIHDIRAVDDPRQGLQIRQNLLAVCRKCHQDATPNFPQAWLSHYVPSPRKTPAVYWTGVFFTALTGVVTAGLVGHILLEFARGALQGTQRDG